MAECDRCAGATGAPVRSEYEFLTETQKTGHGGARTRSVPRDEEEHAMTKQMKARRSVMSGLGIAAVGVALARDHHPRRPRALAVVFSRRDISRMAGWMPSLESTAPSSTHRRLVARERPFYTPTTCTRRTSPATLSASPTSSSSPACGISRRRSPTTMRSGRNTGTC